MQRRMAVLVGILGLLMVAPAAHAGEGPIPFNIDVPIGPVGPIVIDVVPDVYTGFVGACDPQFRCNGFGATGEAGPISGGTSSGRVTLRGYICVMDSSVVCGNGMPATGVMITHREVDIPEPYVGPIYVRLNVCVWLMSPLDDPYACDLPVIQTEGTGFADSGNLADQLPALPGFWLWLDPGSW